MKRYHKVLEKAYLVLMCLGVLLVAYQLYAQGLQTESVVLLLLTHSSLLGFRLLKLERDVHSVRQKNPKLRR